MVDLSAWTQGHPSGTSRLQDFPSGYRSDKSHIRAAWLQDHYFDDGSADSAGVHKLGAAKFTGTHDQNAIPGPGIPTPSTIKGTVGITSNTGRLWYMGSEISEGVQLSAGTAFRFLVVGPQSIGTDEAWVMSWRTADLSANRWQWMQNIDEPFLDETPFVFTSPVTNRSAGQRFITSFISSMDSSGFTAGGASWDGTAETALGAETELIVLSVGRQKRSLFS